MTKADPYEPLKVYLSTSDYTVVGVLVKEVRTDQKPVYYARHTLKDTETHYTKLEKLVFALIMANRKLRQYSGKENQGHDKSTLEKDPP